MVFIFSQVFTITLFDLLKLLLSSLFPVLEQYNTTYLFNVKMLTESWLTLFLSLVTL